MKLNIGINPVWYTVFYSKTFFENTMINRSGFRKDNTPTKWSAQNIIFQSRLNAEGDK